MNRLHRQAILFFLVPLGAVLLVGLPYFGSGHLHRALINGPNALDYLIGATILMAISLPPVLGYRLTVNMARSLAETTQVVRGLAEGDFSRTLSAWAADTSELTDLEQGINATAHHLREQLVQHAQEKARLEAVLRTMVDGMLLLESHKKIVLINPAAEAMFGTERRDAIGRDHLEITHHFDLDDRLDRVLLTGEPEIIEIKRARPEEQVLEARLAPSGEGGILMVMRDVTRFRLLEQMRTEFFSNVTHELRTPLTSIRGFAETLLEGALDDPETAKHFVGIIMRESEHLGRLIEDILDLSRIESGKFKMLKEPLHLHTLVQETLGRLGGKATTLGVALHLDVAETLPVISGDPGRLAQVLLNLVDNALKYTPSGGSVTVSATTLPNAIEVSVIDTGTGIPKVDLPRIFERFYRVDKARTRTTGGTGLGLSIVKHIVDAHGGTIRVVSDVGQGATFTFTLPTS